MTHKPDTEKIVSARSAREAAFGHAIKNYLDASASKIEPRMAQRLVEARRKALVQMNARSAGSTVGVGVGTLAQTPGSVFNDASFWGAGVIVALALALFGWMQWDMNEKATEAAEADTEILSTDLPMDAYFDKGFKSWVKQSE